MNGFNGMTILRFAHAFQSGGGIEQYLADLDRTLLERNQIRILRMYLADDFTREQEQIKGIGRGILVKIPLDAGPSPRENYWRDQKRENEGNTFTKNVLRDWIVYNPILYRILFKTIIKNRRPRPQDISARHVRQETRRLVQKYNIDLLVMHYVGGEDSAEIIEEAGRSGIPYIFINHFSNDRFNHISIRQQTLAAAGIGGVSSVGVPGRLKRSFFNLSDGIDTEMFRPKAAEALKRKFAVPIAILPARIVPTKGQMDLIKSCAELRNHGIRFKVVLAGRVDSQEYGEELKRQINDLGVRDDVLFVGELSREELRNWYGASSILAFPTYHHEGLPRILMEAQAMKIPPVAYDVGGMSEGIQHGKTGYLVRKGDIQTFIYRLRDLLVNERTRNEMGEEGRRFIQEHFSLETLAKRHEEFYSRIIEEAREKQHKY